MAVSTFKTFIAGEVLTAADLNSSFSQVFDNGESLGWPATTSKDLNGNELILDVDADTSITADSDDRVDIRVGGSDEVMIGLDGTNSGGAVTLDTRAVSGTANTNVARLLVDSSNAVTIPAGTTAVAAGAFIKEPNLTATGTITDAASLYIEAAPTEGTDNNSILVEAGDVSLKSGNVSLDSGVMFIKEQAAADADIAGFGQVWVDDATPNELFFTDDAGTDFLCNVGQATQAAIEGETNENTYLPPDLVKHAPGIAKMWVRFDASSGTPTIGKSYNVTSLTDNGVGITTINFTTSFDGAGNYAAFVSHDQHFRGSMFAKPSILLAASLEVQTGYENPDNTSELIDATHVSAAAFGDFV